MKSLLTLLILIFSGGLAQAYDGEIKYPVSQIPKELFKNANAVLRVDENQFTIISPGKATYKSTWAITILNKNGDHYATQYFGYDKLKTITSLKAALYNAFGEEVKRLKKNEISDQSAISSFSLYEDNRVKIVEFVHNEYPYTVEFEIEETYNGLLYYPGWFPFNSDDIAVQSSRYQVFVPKGMKLRYKEFNLSSTQNEQSTEASETSYKENNGVKIQEGESQTIYTWQINNMPVIEYEPYSPKSREQVPCVYLAPSEFEMEGYKGNMDTWKNFGGWIKQLNENKDVLPPATVAQVKALTQDAPNDEEKIRRVYKYLQEKTRYVSIQLGIGGWQPFDATYVDQKSYGDCKALSNYTHSLLNAIGIKSYYTLVNAGPNPTPMIKDFPSTQFNHAILCVPQPKDTIWLECTSQTNPFGYLGDFTGDRDVLLITPEGGKVVHTPIYGKKDNLLIHKAEVKIDAEGNGKAQVNILYKALQEKRPGNASELSLEEQKKWLYQNIKIPSFEISQFKINRKKDRIPSTTIDLDLTVRKMAAKSGKRMFVVPNLMSQWTDIPVELENRKNEVVLNGSYDFVDTDTIVYSYPESYILENKPQDYSFENQFGKYQMKVTVEGNKISYIRRVEMNRGRYPKEEYPALIEFFKNVVKADKQKIVLVQKEG